MKVIGKDADENYIAIVTHLEVQKVFDRYYGSGELKRLNVGSDLNLGDGFDFRNHIQSACKQMVDATKQFHQAQETLLKFAQMVSKLPDASTETESAQ